MTRRFDAFVVFAEMRTGSNHLEESLNSLDDVVCHGELFNPTFIGRHNQFDFLGYDLDRRESDPVGMVDAMMAAGGPMPGLRYFHDHDPRVLDRILSDPRIAKVLLTRNPLDSYISRKIASATGQWRLTDLKHAKSGKITFNGKEFLQMLGDWSAFRETVRRGLQTTGQTAFHVRYEDINDVDILNGLAAFLGSDHRLSAASKRLKRQNPGAVEDKVENAADMVAALAQIDRFGFDRITDGEVPRPPGVSGFVAHPEAGLLFLPLAGALIDPVVDWMAGIGGVGAEGLLTGMTQKDLRKWMRNHPGFSSFSVIRHPMPRVLEAYLRLQSGDDLRQTELREVLQERYKVPFGSDDAADLSALRAFSGVLSGSLKGQTSLKVPAEWDTQAALVQAAAKVLLPQRIIRESAVASELAQIAGLQGVAPPTDIGDLSTHAVVAEMSADGDVRKTVFDAYRKDFIQFGFAPSAIS